jgi:hypothetical protein
MDSAGLAALVLVIRGYKSACPTMKRRVVPRYFRFLLLCCYGATDADLLYDLIETRGVFEEADPAGDAAKCQRISGIVAQYTWSAKRRVRRQLEMGVAVRAANHRWEER